MERHTRSWRKSIWSLALLVTGSVMLLGWSPPASAGTCSPSTTSGSRTDPNTGWRWTTLWFCGNAKGAAVYADANDATRTGTMNSTTSWFVCWKKGNFHAGRNDIWYYTLGDVAVPNLVMHEGKHSGAWGYMPAVNVFTDTDPWPGMPACPQRTSPPAKTERFDKPTYFVHGYADGKADSGGIEIPGPAFDCIEYWSTVTLSYFGSGDPALSTGNNANLIKWGFYPNDVGCTRIGPQSGSQANVRNVPIKTLGADLAWDIYYRYTRWGDSVDLVGHSMGGLVIKAALTGAQINEPGYPPYLYVEDVVTLGTPHQGAVAAIACTVFNVTNQCRDMSAVECIDNPTDCFLKWVRMAPLSRVLTDWTFVASDNDFTVPAWSALAVGIGKTIAPANGVHKWVYTKPQPGGQILGHMDYMSSETGTWNARYCDWGSSCDLLNTDTWFSFYDSPWNPVKLMRYATYYNTW